MGAHRGANPHRKRSPTPHTGAWRRTSIAQLRRNSDAPSHPSQTQMEFLVLLVFGIVAVTLLGIGLWGVSPLWREHWQSGGQEPDPTGNLPPEPQGFEKPPDEGGLL